MIPVDIAPDVEESRRSRQDREALPQRCHGGVIRSAVAGLVRRLLADELDGAVRPWHLPALRERAAHLGAVTGARVVHLEPDVLVAELVPGGERLVFRGVDDGWRLDRFATGSNYAVRPETARRVALTGWGPEAVLDALGLVKPEGVEREYVTADLGQGQTETRERYAWTEAGRSVIAEEVTIEIFDGATPRSTYLRGVVVDGDRGAMLSGSDGSALITEG
ncbi:hypothetical protein PDG61_19145 [Mycolicibacterium sp. BiH015]|uniref:hypothetical protein n=1 Tax=Mycolicibacterium sp. BiH015 TaxID=3018808 RepID=UPI0022E8D42F|nr:hypothetical protein [Mycolicibacterium sp. BiH015]MDA2893046.1 hypothetical protein [Mycolicibacterium sp. BiH015]